MLLCLIAACSSGGKSSSSNPPPCSTALSPEAEAALAMFNPGTAMSLAQGPLLTYMLDICGHPDLGVIARQRIVTAIDACFAADAPRRAAAHVANVEATRAAQCGLGHRKDEPDPARLPACRDLEQQLDGIRARLEGPIDCAKPSLTPDTPPPARTAPEPPK
jgi:hypothetical protein